MEDTKQILSTNIALMSTNPGSQWTAMQNKKFEMVLAVHKEENPDRWHKIAKIVGEKSEEEVKRHYELLVKDVRDIESGLMQLPKYEKAGTGTGSLDATEGQR